MKKKAIFIFFVFVLILAVMSRIFLTMNAVDAERIPDTYIYEAISLGESVSSGSVLEYLQTAQKYPLLGPYLSVPIFAGYYFFEKIRGQTSSMADFAGEYVLGGTHVPILLRFESLLFNLLALFLIYISAKKFFIKYKYAEIFALTAASLSFYVTVFSVSQRIHNIVFFFSALTLYFSLSYFKQATRLNFMLAFLSAGLAFSSSQSGLPSVLLPLTALFLLGVENWQHGEFSLNSLRSGLSAPYLFKKAALGLIIFFVVAIVVGYPGVVIKIATGDIAGIPQIFLSSEHSDPSFSLIGLWTMFKDWFLAFEFLWIIPIVSALFFIIFRRSSFKIEGPDIIALTHIFGFLAIFGLSSVSVGRFGLAIFPSLFFLAGGFISRMIERKWLVCMIISACVVQASLIFSLLITSIGGDTRKDAAKYIIQNTTQGDLILSSVTRHHLGIPATPSAIENQATRSRTDSYIFENNLVSLKSRDFYYFNPTLNNISDFNLKKYKYVLLREPFSDGVESVLRSSGFILVKRISPYRYGFEKRGEDFNWDFFGETSVFNLFKLRKFGPEILVYGYAALDSVSKE